jgi:hypothetical protein
MGRLCTMYVSKVTAGYGGSLTYDAEKRTFVHSTNVSLSGTIEGCRSARIRLSSGNPIIGLPISLRLVQGEPLVFPDPIAVQTKFGEKVLRGVGPIESCIGDLAHSNAISDEFVESAECISGEVRLCRPLFREIVHIVRSSPSKISCISLAVFGQHLNAASDWGASDFVWNIRDGAGLYGLFLGGFSFGIRPRME